MNQKIIDLTMLIEEGMQTFASHCHPIVEITQLGRHGIENRETKKIVLGTHTGTHIDAPRHFIKDGKTIEFIQLEQINGNATVVDFSSCKDKTEITINDLKKELEGYSCERIVLRFDWDIKALGSSRYYKDHPYLSESAATWLVERGCKLIALDTPQPDNPENGFGTEKDAPVHKILLSNNVIIAEYLVNLSQITHKTIQLIVAPIKIKDGDGAPARCFAIEGVFS